MDGQIDLFKTGKEKLCFDKPVRLIELFAGYGSQALALKYLGIPFEHWKISEWAINSIQAYKDMHFYEDNHDYSHEIPIEEIRSYLAYRISSDYDSPLDENQVKRIPEKKCRTIYNNMKASNNIGSVVLAKGTDLNIVDTDKFTYLLTYSFPCQDLSSAGKGAGMERGSGTRSGMLWEVERLLKETENLPQILLMENVPQVVADKNIRNFREWIYFLESKGYTSEYAIINAKDCGVPQNRERCFCISWLGDYYYDFPEKEPLTKRLKDVLEDEVSERYYLAESTIESLIEHKRRHEEAGHGFGWKPTDGGGTHIASKPKQPIVRTVLLSSCGKKLEKETDIGAALMARDYKGFGNQAMTGIMEYDE